MEGREREGGGRKRGWGVGGREKKGREKERKNRKREGGGRKIEMRGEGKEKGTQVLD